MERRFRCTACGKCCYGLLPLSIPDAVSHAGLFPLGVTWSPVRQGHKIFDATAKLGLTVKTPDRKRLAVRITPMAYVPTAMACPALGDDGLCTIQETKPLRCRAMPFMPHRGEAEQAQMLVPRAGWLCDVSDQAPVVYRDKKVVDRDDYDAEQAQLVADSAILRPYGENQLSTVQALVPALAKAAAKPMGGEVLLSFATLLPRLDFIDRAAFAQAQLTVLADFAARVADRPEWADYGQRYSEWITDMERALRRFRPS